jgi:hypothetical protein
MQVTIEITESLYCELESQARETHSSLEELLLDGAHRVVSGYNLNRRGLPLTAAEAGPLVDLGINLNDIVSLKDPDIVRLHEVLKTSAEDAVQEYGLHDSEEDH